MKLTHALNGLATSVDGLSGSMERLTGTLTNGAPVPPLPAPARVAVWSARGDDTPATVAGLLRQAGKLIEAHGYTPAPEGVRWQVEGPHSLSSAIEAAATLVYPDAPADAADAAEDAHARLAGFLHLSGLRTRRTSISDICDEVSRWEDFTPGGPRRTAAEAVAVLDMAATLIETTGGAR